MTTTPTPTTGAEMPTHEQICDLLQIGNPSEEECRLIRLGYAAALSAAAPAAPAAPAEGGPAGSGGWESHAKAMERERDYYRQRVRMMDEHQAGQAWYWQDDGQDHPESMVGSLPVVIRAEQLRALMAASHAKAGAENYPPIGRALSLGSAAPTLRAMSSNYSPAHQWDRLDADACARGAAEIEALRDHIASAAPQAQQPGAAYAELPPAGWYAETIRTTEDAYTADQMRAFADATCALRAVPQAAEVAPEGERAAFEAWWAQSGLAKFKETAFAGWEARAAAPQAPDYAVLWPAARDVLSERRRQVSEEGWTARNDDEHSDGSMALAAACYAMYASLPTSERIDNAASQLHSASGKNFPGGLAWLSIWPWARQWWKPKSPRQDAVRACALLLAEIERIDRAELAAAPQAPAQEGGAA